MNEVRYERILLTSDGSELAVAAAPHARELAQRHDATLVLLAVIPSLASIRLTGRQHGWADVGGMLSDDEVQEAFGRMREQAQSHLAALAAELGDLRSVEMHVLAGSAGPAIVAALDELRGDLIVMSTHGRSGLARTVMGSVADHVVTHARRPVMLVPVREA